MDFETARIVQAVGVARRDRRKRAYRVAELVVALALLAIVIGVAVVLVASGFFGALSSATGQCGGG